MIVDRAQSLLVSNLGWVDKGSLWTFDAATGRVVSIAIGDGDFVRLLAGQEDLFVAQLISEKHEPWMVVTVRRAGAPDEVVAQWRWGDDQAVGDKLAWEAVPHVFVGYDRASQHYVTVEIDPVDRRVTVEPVEWFDDSYDWGYQQPMTVTAVPGSGLLLYSVQRSSLLVLYDPDVQRVVRQIPLAGSGGNPVPHFRAGAPELWAADYDHLVCLDRRTWEVIGSRRLQDTGDGSRLFIGNFAFDSDQRRCVVARPFSGDAIALDCATFQPIGRVTLGKKPLDIALLDDGSVVARDWTTGAVLSGHLAPEAAQQ